jgi:hypothetical protein
MDADGDGVVTAEERRDYNINLKRANTLHSTAKAERDAHEKTVENDLAAQRLRHQRKMAKRRTMRLKRQAEGKEGPGDVISGDVGGDNTSHARDGAGDDALEMRVGVAGTARLVRHLRRVKARHVDQARFTNRHLIKHCIGIFLVCVVGGAIFRALEADAEVERAGRAWRAKVDVLEYLDASHRAWRRWRDRGMDVDDPALLSPRPPQPFASREQPADTGSVGALFWVDGSDEQRTEAVGLVPPRLHATLTALVRGDTPRAPTTRRDAADPPPPRWDVCSAMFFVVSLMTTVGFGGWTPATRTGRLFAAAAGFAAVGYFYYALSHAAERVLHWIARSHRHGRRWRRLVVIKLMVINALLFAVAASAIVDDWSLGDSLYFAVTTLTTVGLGDLDPGRDGRIDGRTLNGALNLLTLSAFLIMGLCLAAALAVSVVEDFYSTVEGTTVDLKDHGRSLDSQASWRVRTVKDGSGVHGVDASELSRLENDDAAIEGKTDDGAGRGGGGGQKRARRAQVAPLGEEAF